jgi:putative peptide maturation system protein
MNNQLPQVRRTLSDTLDCLMELAGQNVAPDAARERFRRFQQQHHTTPMDLVWEVERIDGSVHYDALLHLPGEGTVSLSFAPDRALPWPVRGTRRWDESTLLRVNQEFVNMEQAVACLDFLWQEAPLMKRLIHVGLIQEELKRNPFDLSDDELQQAMDAFRRTHKLYRAADLPVWLERHGLTHEKLEKLVGDEAVVDKLRERVTSGQVEPYFDQHHAGFDRVMGLRVEFPDEPSASDALARMISGEIEFHRLAQERFVAASYERPGAARSGYFTLRREDADAKVFEAMFSAKPGSVFGPSCESGRWSLAQVLGAGPAVLDEEMRGEIQKRLFADWLEQRRRQATIEWLWGNVTQTAAE